MALINNKYYDENTLKLRLDGRDLTEIPSDIFNLALRAAHKWD